MHTYMNAHVYAHINVHCDLAFRNPAALCQVLPKEAPGLLVTSVPMDVGSTCWAQPLSAHGETGRGGGA